MAEDIAPALLDKVEKNFHARLEKAKATKSVMLKRARDGTVNVYQYTNKVGKALSRAFIDEIVPEVLPNGTLYYNIAEKVLVPPIKEAHGMVSDVASEVQLVKNKKAGIGIKPIRPPIEEDRVQGIVDMVTNGAFVDNIHYLNEPIRNLIDHFGDYHAEKNAEFLTNTGLEITITRIASANSCEWCEDRAGVYHGYREALDNEAFARHEGCRCEVELSNGYKSGKMRASGRGFTRTQ